jgi:hypothetical protein
MKGKKVGRLFKRRNKAKKIRNEKTFKYGCQVANMVV